MVCVSRVRNDEGAVAVLTAVLAVVSVRYCCTRC